MENELLLMKIISKFLIHALVLNTSPVIII